MSDVIRKIFSKLNRSLAENLTARRHKFHVPIRITLMPTESYGGGTGKLTFKKESLTVSGETEDLSETGLAFTVPSIRLREYYLVGEQRVLIVELDLPNGKVEMKVVGVRYEQQSGIHDSAAVSYLIGAKIVSIEVADKEIYKEYLRLGGKLKRNSKAQDFSLKPEG